MSEANNAQFKNPNPAIPQDQNHVAVEALYDPVSHGLVAKRGTNITTDTSADGQTVMWGDEASSGGSGGAVNITEVNGATANLAQETGGNLASTVTVLGSTTDAAVTGDTNGTISGKQRGLVKILTDIWDSINHRIKVDGSGVTQPTVWTQPGTSVTASNTASAGAALTITLSGVSGKTTYLRTLTIVAGAVASQVQGLVTITGMIGGTFNYYLVETVAAGGVIHLLFPDGVPASAVDTSIAVVIPAISGGGVISATATGFQM